MADRGRPSEYTPEKAEAICAWLSEGKSLLAYTELEGTPCFSTICRWKRQNEDFRKSYDAAREDWADHVFEDLFRIADDGQGDRYVIMNDDGEEIEKAAPDVVQRSRLRVDTRKWALARMNAKRFGERTAVDVGGQPDNPLNLADLIAKAQAK